MKELHKDRVKANYDEIEVLDSFVELAMPAPIEVPITLDLSVINKSFPKQQLLYDKIVSDDVTNIHISDMSRMF